VRYSILTRRRCAFVSPSIALGVLDRPVPGELLYVAQTATGFGDEPRGIGDEGASPRV
jgi:hypothetical protein